MTCVLRPNVIVGSENPRQQVDEGLLDAVRAHHGDVIQVEEHDEDASMRVGGELVRHARRRRIDALGLRSRGRDDDVLESVDFLRRALLVELEVRSGEVLDRDAVLCGEHVDLHEVRPAAEPGWLLRRTLRGEQQGRREHQEFGHVAPRRQAGCFSVPPMPRRSTVFYDRPRDRWRVGICDGCVGIPAG
jgi:hypothetical protein